MEATQRDEMENKARDQARAQLYRQLYRIVSMVRMLEHVQLCDGDEDCQLTDAEIYDGINLHYEEQKATEKEREEYHDEDAAQRVIDEDPLSIQVQSG